MSLARTIKQLEQEIAAEKAAIYRHFAQATQQFKAKLATPPVLLIALLGGGLLGAKIKRKLTAKSLAKTVVRTKTSLAQRVMALSSEAMVAVKFFNRVKPTVLAFIDKMKHTTTKS